MHEMKETTSNKTEERLAVTGTATTSAPASAAAVATGTVLILLGSHCLLSLSHSFVLTCF